MASYELYDEKSIFQDDIKIQTVDDALDLLNSKYDSIIITGEILVSDISMQYLPQRYGGGRTSKIKLKPSWIFEII